MLRILDNFDRFFEILTLIFKAVAKKKIFITGDLFMSIGLNKIMFNLVR